MKSCTEYEALVSAFLDGEITEAERAGLAEHLTGCPACQQYFDDLVAIHDAFEREEAVVPEDFAASVMERVRATPQEREEKVLRFPRWRQWAAQAVMPGIPAAEPSGEVSEVSGDMPEEAEAGGAAAFCMDEDGGQAETPADRAVVYDEAPVLAAAAPKEESQKNNSLAGVLVAGGETARRWVEEELGLAWAAGQTYPLTEEEYAGLLAALTEAGEDFRQEAGEPCLRAEEPLGG